MGEAVERELDRLIKRDTLISVPSLGTLQARSARYVEQVDKLSQAMVDLWSVVTTYQQL